MTDEMATTINAVCAIGTTTWALLGFVLWYFKRDSFLIVFPSAEFVIAVPSLAVWSIAMYFFDFIPGEKLGPVGNAMAFILFIALIVLPVIWGKLMKFRTKIVGNKIK